MATGTLNFDLEVEAMLKRLFSLFGILFAVEEDPDADAKDKDDTSKGGRKDEVDPKKKEKQGTWAS